MTDPTTAISLCMIVRDEEHRLARCLGSVRGAVDEMVVVDTGSRDATCEVAARHGARVVRASWNDDFSEARNRSLDHARTPWALVLDADEMLSESDAPRIRRAVQDNEASGYFLHFENPVSSCEVLRFLIVRLLRRAPGVRFQNVIHEQATTSLNEIWQPLGKRLKVLDVVVHHEGYREEVMQERSKEDRNIRLFEKQLRLYPEDVYSWYKYGDFLRRTHSRERALGALKKAFDLLVSLPHQKISELPYAGEIVTLLALELHERGVDEEALRLLEDTAELFPPSTNRDYVYAGLALRVGRPGDARLAYERCLAARGRTGFVAQRDGITGYLSLTGLAAVAAGEGRIDEASRTYRQALAESPTHRPAAIGLASLCGLSGEPRAGLAVLEEYLGHVRDDPHAWLRGAGLWLRCGDPGMARAWVEEARACAASAEGLARVGGAVELAAGRPREARALFATLPEDAECAAGLTLALLMDGQVDEAARHAARWTDLRVLETFADLLEACGVWDAVRRAASGRASIERLFERIGSSRDRLVP